MLQAIQTISISSCKLTCLLSRLFGIVLTYTLLYRWHCYNTLVQMESKMYPFINYRDSIHYRNSCRATIAVIWENFKVKNFSWVPLTHEN